MKVMQRSIILLGLLFLTAGCVTLAQRVRSASVSPPIRRLAHAFTIRFGEKLLLEDEGLAVSFTKVSEDSRCPAKATCVVRGNAKIIISVQHGDGTAQRVELDTDPALERTRNRTEDGEYQVELVALDLLPDPADKPTLDQRYIATLIVTKAVAAPTATPTATQIPTLTPTPTTQATPIRTTDKTLTAALHEPFALSVGQTAQIADEDFRLTLRSADDNSGCFSEDDCSTMQFSGTLAAQKGDQKQLMTIMAGFNADSPFTTDFAGYTIVLSSVKKLADGSIIATFVVADTLVVQATAQPAPPPQFVEACPFMSRFDAAALLQENVQDQAVANLRFAPTSSENEDQQGLCGYVSAAYRDDQQPDLSVPHLAVAIEADHAVAAARLTGNDTSQLLQIAEIIHAANPENDTFDLAVLKAMVAAGDGEGLLEKLYASAQGSQTLHAKFVENLQKQALWVWQTYKGGHFAALIAYDGSEFTLVAALLGQAADEGAVQAKATILIQQTAPTASPIATPTPVAKSDFEAGCPFLSQADAIAVLGEPVLAGWDGPATLCGYGGLAQKLDDTRDILALGSTYGVAAGVLSDQATNQWLLNLVEALHKDNAQHDPALYPRLKTWLMAGMNEDVISQLAQLVDGSSTWNSGGITDLGKFCMWLSKTTAAGDQITLLLAPRIDAGTIFVIAQTKGTRDQQGPLAAMITVAAKLTK